MVIISRIEKLQNSYSVDERRVQPNIEEISVRVLSALAIEQHSRAIVLVQMQFPSLEIRNSIPRKMHPTRCDVVAWFCVSRRFVIQPSNTLNIIINSFLISSDMFKVLFTLELSQFCELEFEIRTTMATMNISSMDVKSSEMVELCVCVCVCVLVLLPVSFKLRKNPRLLNDKAVECLMAFVSPLKLYNHRPQCDQPVDRLPSEKLNFAALMLMRAISEDSTAFRMRLGPSLANVCSIRH